MRKLVMTAICLGVLLATSSAPALASVTPTTGQPGAPANTCGPDNPVTPGASATAPGSAFNSAGQAGLVYAGNLGTHSLVSNNPAVVSQYDVACVRLSH